MSCGDHGRVEDMVLLVLCGARHMEGQIPFRVKPSCDFHDNEILAVEADDVS